MTYEQVLMYKKAALEVKEDTEKLPLKNTKKQQKKQFKKDVKELRTNPLTRSNRRDTGKLHSLIVGNATSQLLAGGTGALIGGVIGGATNGRLGALRGVVAGGTTGVGLAAATQAVAALIGALRRVRTDKLQAKYEASKGATAANYLLPGAAIYNRIATDAANRNTLSKLRLGKL